MNTTKRLLLCLLALTASGSLQAHHSAAPHFDLNSEVIVEGEITRIRLVNPHAYLYFDVEKNGKTEKWRCELSAGTTLKRRGWTADKFPVGAKITVNGSPARREDHHCYLNSLTFEDGTVVSRRTDFNNMGRRRGRGSNELASGDRPAYLENGQPNIEGAWVSLSFGRSGMGQRPRYRATSEGREAAEGYEMAFDDPILRCHIVNIIDGWNHDRHVNEITQTDTTITLQYGFMDFVRTIYLDQDEHPKDIVPSTGGHSIGRWEGDTLVVETTQFHPQQFLRLAIKHQVMMGDDTLVTERFTRINENEIIYEFTVSDDALYTQDWRGELTLRATEGPIYEYACHEGNYALPNILAGARQEEQE